jgi:glutathione S-transferase
MPWTLPYVPPPVSGRSSAQPPSHDLSFARTEKKLESTDALVPFEERQTELETIFASLTTKLSHYESLASGAVPFSQAESKKPPVDLTYFWDESGPECQGPILLLQKTDLKFQERKFSISQEREHTNRTDPENKKHNFNHSLPTLVDNHAKFSVFESHSILRYLAEKFFPNSHWYPSDLKTRTKINNYLDWHSFTIRSSFMIIGLSYLPGFTKTGVDKSKSYVQLAQEVFYGSSSHLWKDRADNGLVNQLRVVNDRWLKESKFLAGDEVSIADLSLYGDAGYLIHLFGFDFKSYPALNRWYQTMEEQFGNLPARKAYVPIMKTFGGLFKDIFPTQKGGGASVPSPAPASSTTPTSASS